MAVFKPFSLGIAILVISCGGSVDAGNSSTDNVGGFGDTMSTGGSHRGGAAPAAGGSTQPNIVATSGTGGTAASSYSGGLTPVTYNALNPSDPLNPVVPNTQRGCGWGISALAQSSCTFSVSPRVSGFDNSVSVQVIYSVNIYTSDAFLIGQSQLDCLQGDGWYFDTNGNITLCPQTCVAVLGNSNSFISINVSCQNSSDCPCP